MENLPHTRQTLPFGSVVGKYTIIRIIGQGGFGDIYLVCSNETDQAFAMKVEISEARKQSLHQEVSFMFNVQGSPHFPHLIEFSEDSKHRYLVQELLGPSLSALRRCMPDQKFSMGTSLRVAQHMLKILKEFHARGFIHNDIKPSNFLLRPGSPNSLVLIDFGLSKAYIDPKTGRVNKVRQFAGFKGTKKYASPNAHIGFDLTVRDDMYSWFYTLVELSSGSLPWKMEKTKVGIMKGKRNIRSTPEFQALPERVQNLLNEIEELGLFKLPDYDRYIDEIEKSFDEAKIERPKVFDWEMLDTSDVMRISAIPLKLEPGKYAIEPDFYNLAVDENGKLTLAFSEGRPKLKKFHPVSTVCNLG